MRRGGYPGASMDFREAPMVVRRLLPLLVLAACATGPAAVPADSLRDSLEASRASLRAIRGEAPAPTPATPTAVLAPAASVPPTVAASAAPAAPPPPRRPGAPAPATAAELMRHTADTVRAALGEPSLRRAEGPAEIWLYEARLCRLDLILYRDGPGPLRVAHAQARAAGIEAQSEADCLREIAGGRAAPPPFQPRA